VKARKVLFFYQHFWPDSPPYASMLRSIGVRLNAFGFHVGMLTAQPSYKPLDFANKALAAETLDSIEVKRLGNLPGASKVRLIALVGKVLFPIRAMFVVLARKLLGAQPDVVVAATIPPVLNGGCGLLAARIAGVKFVYHMQDIYPEIGVAGSLWSERSIRYKVLVYLDTYVSRRADACVVLSQDMQSSLVTRGVDKSSIYIINNFTLESFEDALPAGTLDKQTTFKGALDTKADDMAVDKKYRIVFAGNLGRFQALEALLDAFLDDRCQALPIELHFLGDGAVKAELQNKASSFSSVCFHGHVPFDQAARFIADCDAGIVSISPGVIKYAYPSKTLSYLGLGVPLFALVEKQSELASDIEKQNLGVVCTGQLKEDLIESYQNLVTWLRRNENTGDRIKQYAMLSGSPDAAAEKWNLLLGDII